MQKERRHVPIRIFCEDSTSNGLTVLNGGEVVLNHVSFEGLSALNQKKWELKGGITIYESNVSMKNCSIFESCAEHALSIIRSNFEITDLTVENAAGDGFNTAYSSGTISNSSFLQMNDDAMDFKGGTIIVENTHVKYCKDAGILGKEKTLITINNVTIK